MRIIGIDPGTAITGYSILEITNRKIHLLDYGCITTAAGLADNIRLQQIAEDMESINQKWKPNQAAIEKIFFQKNVKTAITVAQARGVILQKLTAHGAQIHEYTPLEIKAAVCGNGQADKKMVQQMVKITFNLQTIPKPDDAADAVAAALCLAHSLKFNSKILA